MGTASPSRPSRKPASLQWASSDTKAPSNTAGTYVTSLLFSRRSFCTNSLISRRIKPKGTKVRSNLVCGFFGVLQSRRRARLSSKPVVLDAEMKIHRFSIIRPSYVKKIKPPPPRDSGCRVEPRGHEGLQTRRGPTEHGIQATRWLVY